MVPGRFHPAAKRAPIPSMITTSDPPRRGRVLEIAVVLSILLHILLGGLAFRTNKELQKIVQRMLPKEQRTDELVVTSSQIRIERRKAPRYAPPVKPKQQKRLDEKVAAAPKLVETPATAAPKPKPTEIAKLTKNAPPQHDADLGKASSKRAPVLTTTKVARVALPKLKNQMLSDEQLAAFTQHAQQAIDAARVASDPTHVDAQPSGSTMKHYALDISGVDSALRRGEGYLYPQDRYRDKNTGQQCYYVNFDVVFNTGGRDNGYVYWPICYTARNDPFLNNIRRFPLPPPPDGWTPTAVQLKYIAQHPVLRAYFPDQFPADANNGN